jgi:hypothetical protein
MIVMARGRQTTGHDEFLAIVCADEELLRSEFEAIIDACWGGPPPAEPTRPGTPADRCRQDPEPEADVRVGAASARVTFCREWSEQFGAGRAYQPGRGALHSPLPWPEGGIR